MKVKGQKKCYHRKGGDLAGELSFILFCEFIFFGPFYCFCYFLLLQFFCFFDVAPCAAFAAPSDSAFGALLHTSKQRHKRRSGPSVSGVEALRPPLQPLPALRCLKLSLQLHSKDVGSRSGAAETMFKAAPQRIRF